MGKRGIGAKRVREKGLGGVTWNGGRWDGGMNRQYGSWARYIDVQLPETMLTIKRSLRMGESAAK